MNGVLLLSEFLLLFFILLITVSFLSFEIVYLIDIFTDVHFIAYLIVTGTSIVLDIVLAIIINVGFDRGNSVAWFLYDHALNFLTGCCFLGFFFSNLREEPVLGIERATDLIEIEWTIYAITVTVFVVWRKLVFDRIYNSKKIMEEDDENESSKDEKIILESLEEKNRLRRVYISRFEPVMYLIVDLALVSAATVFCFMLPEYKLFQEAIVFFAALSCIYSLSVLMIEIVLDLFFKRTELVNKTKVKPSHFNDLKEMKVVRVFLENLDDIDKNTTPLNNYKSGSKKTDACIARCYQLLLEYRQDKRTAFTNKKELLLLSRQLPEMLKKTNNDNKKKMKKLNKEMTKIKKIFGDED